MKTYLSPERLMVLMSHIPLMLFYLFRVKFFDMFYEFFQGAVEALGLLRTWKTNAPEKFDKALRSNGKVLIARHDDPAKKIELAVYLLTSVGQQILRLGKFQSHWEYLRKIGKVIHDQGFSVTRGDYIQVSDTALRFFNEVRIEGTRRSSRQSCLRRACGVA
jgi:hypothetical protein